MATWTIQGIIGAQILVEGGGTTLNVGSKFMIDPTWDYSTSRRTFVFTDTDDSNLAGDTNFLADEIGNDSTQTVAIYDAAGNLVDSGTVYAESSATFTAPDGTSITLYVLEINGRVVGEVFTAPLVPGVTYSVTATGDPSTGPAYSTLASMTFDPDLANSITGGSYGDSILAGAGNDTVKTGAGSDTIDGGSGDDWIEFGIGGDVVHGGDGNDRIDDYDGSSGYVWNDTIYGDAGNDTIYAGAGNDYIDGGADNDLIMAEDGADTVWGGTGADTIFGGNGGDQIHGGDGADSLSGEGDNDSIWGDAGADTIEGGAGNDSLWGGADADVFRFWSDWGSDTVWGDSLGNDEDMLSFVFASAEVSVTFTGSEDGTASSGTNTVAFDNIEGVYGSNYADTINAGVDASGLMIDGRGGNDSIIGGSGADSILGGSGDDTIYSGLGNDTVLGGDGNDLIDDLAGVRAESFASTVDAGAGNDTVFTGGGSDTILGGAGNDVLQAEAGDDLVYGDAGSDTIDGGEGNDTIFGGDDGDSVWGNSGDDLIYGEGGNDTLLGAAGNDTLSGGTGSDLLYGGDDADTFLFAYGVGASSIYGGEGGTDLDVVVLSGAAAQVTWTGFESGTITYAGDPNTHYFWEIEQIIGTDYADTFNAAAALTGVSLAAGAGDDQITGSDFADSLDGGAGTDTILAGAGNDTLQAVAGDDLLDGGAGDDYLHGGTGDTTLTGGAGNDTLVAGSGTNWLLGGEGDDSLVGSTDATDETLDAGAGADTILAGAGNSQIVGGAGDDRITTGDGADTLVLADGFGHDFITDFNNAPNGAITTDQLNVTGLHDAQGDPVKVWDVTVGDDGLGNAVLQFPDGSSVTLLGLAPTAVSSTQVLHAMGIPCIVAGMRVATPRGSVAVETLRPGDLVCTRHGLPLPVLWVGQREVTAAQMRADARLLPVEIAAGALGRHGPVRLSALHGVQVPEGVAGALARAGHLAGTGWGGARVLRGYGRHEAGVSYHHILLPRHALISVEGLWVESLWPGAQALAGFDATARAGVIRAIPALAAAVWGGAPVEKVYGAPAARFLPRRQIDRAACARWSLWAQKKTLWGRSLSVAAGRSTAFSPIEIGG